MKEAATDGGTAGPSWRQTLVSESCKAGFRDVEFVGTCTKHKGATAYIQAQGSASTPVGLQCIEGQLPHGCEVGRTYAVSGAVSAVVDQRQLASMDCQAFGHNLGSAAGCKEAQAEPLRIVLAQGCIVRAQY
ncbi:hypothetical protein [Myxococcus sp. Y35]|uniref:hypothetical protein n=1 Tax=Pseudomyxococcus flavus TaxID=3115648 RepID=UPI003CEAC27A